MAAAIRRALAERPGDLLAFLPGVAEIERTAERLDACPPDVDLHRLHGRLDPAAQRAAIRAAPPGRRKVVLATSIAETSLTLDGVRIVVDSGLARRPRYDRAAGLTRLVTERASQAAVTQRAGRAGRQAPGAVYRLWEAAATASLPRFDPPEILEADLSALLLDCALWGVADPRALRWLDPPPEAAVAEARRAAGRRSARSTRPAGRRAHGRAIAALPLPPRLAHMLIEADGAGLGRDRGRGRGAAFRARAGRQRRRSRAAAAPLARRQGQARRGGAGPARGDGCALERRRRPRTPLDARRTSELGAVCRAGLSRSSVEAAAMPPGPTGSASAGAASGSIRPIRSPATNGLRSPRSAARPAGARILAAAPIDQATVEALFAERIADRRAGRVRSRDRRRSRQPWPAAGRDHAFRRAGQPRRSGGDRGGAARRRARARARSAAVERGGAVAAHPRRLRAARRAVARRPFRRGAARPISTNGCRRCSPAGGGSAMIDAGRADGGARSAAGLAGPPGGRTARAEPFRDAGRQPPSDRL